MQNKGLGFLAFKPQFWVNEVTRFGFDLDLPTLPTKNEAKYSDWMGSFNKTSLPRMDAPSRSFSGHDLYMYGIARWNSNTMYKLEHVHVYHT